MSSVNDQNQPDIADKNHALTESLLLMRECIILTRLEAAKAHRDEAAIEAIAQSTFDKLAPKRLIRLEPAIETYLKELRQGHGARICHQKTDVICRLIYDAHIECLLPVERAPYVIDRNYPSLAILKHVKMRFSNHHMNSGDRSSEMMRVHHYELLLEAVVKKLPKLRAWLASIKTHKHTHHALEGTDGPGEWSTVEGVAEEALEAGNRPLDSTRAITKLAWMKGWDKAMRLHGDQPVYPWKNRALVAGYHIQFCLMIAQGICPICCELLLSDLSLTCIHKLLAAMHQIHFDHFLMSLKGASYNPTLYWYNQPLLLELNKENAPAAGFTTNATRKDATFRSRRQNDGDPCLGGHGERPGMPRQHVFPLKFVGEI
jgi:hypothetical protein